MGIDYKAAAKDEILEDGQIATLLDGQVGLSTYLTGAIATNQALTMIVTRGPFAREYDVPAGGDILRFELTCRSIKVEVRNESGSDATISWELNSRTGGL